MLFIGKSLALFPLVAFGIASTSAKTLTEKQALDAAARIDHLLSADLKAANLSPTGRIDDGTFLRRAYLGIIGRIPSEKEARAFLDDPSPDKRAALVNSLTSSPGFDSHLFNWAGDLLRLQTRQEQFGLGWHVWLRKSLSENKPWDVLVREMLSSTGHTAKNPAVGYYLRDRNMQLDNFSNTMQVFLGRQIGCAQCHDHPFDDWSQMEYYRMAAFGGGFEYRSEDAKETVRRVIADTRPETQDKRGGKGAKKDKKALRASMDRQRSEARTISRTIAPLFGDFNKNALIDDPAKSLHLPEDYQYKDGAPGQKVDAETLFGVQLKDVPPEQRREAFAKWVTSPENPFFTKVIANRLWARTFGHGLHDPIDDWTDSSNPAHPEVLAFLEVTMKAVDYDLRQFCRILFLTNLFQRECDPTEPQPGTPHLVRGPALQRMSAEQIHDSMVVLTHGEINDSPLDTNESRWESYTQSVAKLMSADSRDLLVLGESASQAEAAYREARTETRALQAKVAKAGSPEERRKIYQALVTARNKELAFRRQSDPLSSMGMSMMEMDSRSKGKRAGKSTARASELPAPFNPGTLVREFGGSDRETPSSGDTIPTVPQALALLNDYETDILGDRRSDLAGRLSSLKSPEERLDLIFLLLYSRPPTIAENRRFAPLAKDNESLRELTRAMLTSNRFIFIQ
ncbi:DUF1549 domain-containing protein [Akkermansiaceae bacterium]|nr:DUF1549 domain-containing protein [Akkermansiaceae bacterium]